MAQRMDIQKIDRRANNVTSWWFLGVFVACIVAVPLFYEKLNGIAEFSGILRVVSCWVVCVVYTVAVLYILATTVVIRLPDAPVLFECSRRSHILQMICMIGLLTWMLLDDADAYTDIKWLQYVFGLTLPFSLIPLLFARIRIYEHGVWYINTFIPWSQIIGYEWRRHTLLLRVEPQPGKAFTRELDVPTRYLTEARAFLDAHLAENPPAETPDASQATE